MRTRLHLFPPWELGCGDARRNTYNWELYNLTEDYSQAKDLAAQMPGKLKEMQALFFEGSPKVQRLPTRQLGIRTGHHATAEHDRGQDSLHL